MTRRPGGTCRSERGLHHRRGDRRAVADHLTTDALARRHESEGVVKTCGDDVLGVMPQPDRCLRMGPVEMLEEGPECLPAQSLSLESVVDHERDQPVLVVVGIDSVDKEADGRAASGQEHRTEWLSNRDSASQYTMGAEKWMACSGVTRNCVAGNQFSRVTSSMVSAGKSTVGVGPEAWWLKVLLVAGLRHQ